MPAQPEIVRTVAAWARSKGIKRPTTRDGMQALVAAFMAEHGQGIARAYWDEIPDAKRTHLIEDGATVQIADPHEEYDDFNQMVAERNQAMDAVGGDDLAREALLLEQGRAKLAAATPFTRAAPKSASGAILGGTATITQPSATAVVTGGGGNPFVITPAPQPDQFAQQVAAWYGDSDADTRQVTIDLDLITPINGFYSGVIARPFAFIQFGTRASLSSVYVDIGRGVQLSVPGSMVTVSVGLDQINYATTLSTQVQIAGMLSFGTAFRTSKATRTVYFDGTQLIQTAVTNVVVPKYAHDLTFVVKDSSTAITLSLIDANASIIATYALAAGFMGATAPVTIQIPNDVVGVQINKTAGNDTVGRVVFGLAL